ncbi:MAG: YbaN family protein [Hyphomonadaceae bacterium]
MTPSPPPPKAPPKSHALTRPLFFVAGLLLVVVGIVGYFTPGMPGTIFLILAAGCFARSSPKLEAWLLNHPKLGPSVVAWRKNGAIPRKIKFVAIGSMAISFVIVLLVHLPAVWTAVVSVVLLASALFVATRPEGPKTTG